jgi:peptidyl-prolyl cis-trans isomerase C
MQEQAMKNFFRTPWLTIGILLIGFPYTAAFGAGPDDVIARVGEEVITFQSLDVTINRSAVVGIPIPPPGTQERTTMRLTLLDRRISSNLLYLDALAKNVDQDAVFQSNVTQYSDTILGMMYKQQYLIGEIPISDDEIREYFEQNIAEGTPFTQDLHMSIEAVLRKQQFKQRVASSRERLRTGVEVQVFADRLNPRSDAERKSSEVVAIAGGESITWGQVRQRLTRPGQANGPAARREQLEDYIDSRIMVQKARAAGLDREENYQRRLKEFNKSSLVNLHRARLEEQLSPTDEEIRAYYAQHRDRIMVRELRNVQMIVVTSEDQAAEIRHKIESGELTFYEAASEFSIDPNAKMNLGELGWVPQGSGFADLDRVTFALDPNEIGGPVESPAGWHLVRVLEVRDGQYGDIDDPETWKQTRRLLLHERENRYVADLRTTTFAVEVYDDVFKRLTREEANALEAAQK